MDANIKRKEALLASSERHKAAVNKDLKVLSEKTDKIVGDTLLITSVLLSAIAIYKMLKGKGGRKSSRTRKSSRLMKLLKQQVILYILNEGRSKIMDYINTLDETKS